MDLHAREGYWTKQLSCVNKCVAGRLKHESNKLLYNEINKAEVSGHSKQKKTKNEQHVEHIIKEYKKQYLQNNNQTKKKSEYQRIYVCIFTYIIIVPTRKLDD